MIFDLLKKSLAKENKFIELPQIQASRSSGCGGNCSCDAKEQNSDGYTQVLNKKVSRRSSMKDIAGMLLVGAGLAQSSCSIVGDDNAQMKWDEYFKKNYRLMTSKEKSSTVSRLQKLYENRTGKTVNIDTKGPEENVLFGYAFNISKCQGYMDCVNACVEENNQDRSTAMQYIRIHEHENGTINFDESSDEFFHEVPAEGHFYMGTQCFHCENPPCVDVCPVKATWQEEDGIVVIDYDWCIGCRYCMAACPYDGRRFNWKEPEVPEEEINKDQHYLGNRMRSKGVMEKCTFCIQRSRDGKNPACVEACPTGARIFGNLLDPDSQIRWVLENKKVFRLKEDLGTEPKFWYFMD
jgi:molybdopterin-containing oxidoreductase family iron-sulfur binding subunit